MEAELTTRTVEKIAIETEEVVMVTMTRREAEVIRSVLYLAEFNWNGQQDDPQLQAMDDLSKIRYSLGEALGWTGVMFVVDTDQRLSRETVIIKLR